MKSVILMAFFISIILFIGGILSINLKAQEIPQIVFTEIMYDLEGSDSGREWVEIYNRGSLPMEIIEGSGSNSWRFNDGSNHTLNLYQGDLVLNPEETAVLTSNAETFLLDNPGFIGTIIDTVMNLNNTSDTISLSTDAGQTLFAEVTYQSTWGAGGNGYTLEKIDLNGGEEQNNWQESAEIGGSPGSVNQGSPPPPPPINNPPVAAAGPDQTVQINQTVTFDGSGSYDPDNDPLTYSWDFGDQTSGQGEITTHIYSATGTFIVTLEVSDGELQDSDTLQVTVEEEGTPPPPPPDNQAPIAEAGEDQTVFVGETVTFDGSNSYDPDNDELTYHWDFGNSESAEGVAVSYQYSQAESYTVTLTVSDGELEDQDNLIIEVLENTLEPGPSSGGGGQPESLGYSDEIIINEILPNPIGSDAEAEFIELFNKSYNIIDLMGWQLQDNSSRVYIIEEGGFSSTEIPPGGYFVITKDISGISLNNSGGDRVILYQPDGNQLEVVEYSSSALEGKSYALKSNGDWAWTIEPTPGSQNSFMANQPPEAGFELSADEVLIDEPIEFDGSSSTDPDGDQITYNWNFGDGSFGDEVNESHIYETAGIFNIILEVIDSEGLVDASTKQITVKMPENEGQIISSLLINSDYNSIFINEFVVNPSGSDDLEWVELFNQSTNLVDLSGLKLDDAEGGSKPFELAGLSIEPYGYLVINRSDSKIALNNSSDSVRLLTADDQVIQEVIYDSAKEGKSYCYNQILNDWFWSEEPTLGTENILPFVGEFNIAGDIESQNSFFQLSEIKELDKGTAVFTRGVVTVEPGNLGKNVFYISEADDSGEIFLNSGIEVYSSKAEFPMMSAGDIIELNGKVSETKGKKRINLQTNSQINIIDHRQLPEPDQIPTGEMSDDLIGSLIQVVGTLLEKKTSNYFLDDGSGEIQVYVKKTTGIPKLDVAVGYVISAIGILDLTDSGFRILPRYSQDLNVGEVLGEYEIELSDEVIAMEADDQKKQIIEYLLFGIGSLLLILIALFIRLKIMKK